MYAMRDKLFHKVFRPRHPGLLRDVYDFLFITSPDGER
jgi:hypothetical protein